ncbi:MAG: lipoprotein insertase outer membrane protein LolB [Rubrivivax sp.]
MKARRHLLGASLGAGLSVLLVAGCATVRPPDAPGPVLSGRLAWQVAATAEQPARQASALFDLRGTAERGSLDLSSALGTTLARARWEPGQAELSSSAAGVQRFTGLDELAQSAFGEPVPLAALFDWLRGRPWAGAPHDPVSAAERQPGGIAGPIGFRQLGWEVDLSGLAQGLLSARRAAEPVVTLRLRLEAPS